MLTPIRSRWVAVFGLLCMLPLAAGLLDGSMPLDVAATRAAVLLVVLSVVDKVVMPLATALLGPPQRRAADRRVLDQGAPDA